MWVVHVINTFKVEFLEKNIAVSELFEWLHSSILIYICIEYIISINENINRINGKPIYIIPDIRKMVKKKFGYDIEEKEKEKIEGKTREIK